MLPPFALYSIVLRFPPVSVRLAVYHQRPVTMDNSAWPSVPWTEYLNGEFEDEYTALYPPVNKSTVNSRPGGDGQNVQPIDAPDSSAVAIREWPTEECVSERSVFPCDFNQALSASTGLNCDGGVNSGKLLRSQVMFDIVL